MPQVRANGVMLEYEITGDAAAEPVLLIMGLGAQLTRWSPDFATKLAARGYRVIRFDNRDIGLSEKMEAAGPPDIPALFAARNEGKWPKVAYNLDDMAADAAGLLGALGIARAHIVGASMGGMIAQLVAADHPEKTLSLTSIMSTTGNPALPPATPEAMERLNMPAPDPTKDLEAYVAQSIDSAKVLGSPGFPVPDETLRAEAVSTVKRSYYPMGFMRQYAAILGSPDRRPKLATITAPTVVIHGEADPLVPVEGGRDTAASIPGAELVEIPGMGHDVPAPLYDRIIDGIVKAATRAKATA
jgi:pimeloyl-ACP methyl ester carboxylesterase